MAEREAILKYASEQANAAYSRMIESARREACFGADFKLSHGAFSKENLAAHEKVAKFHGKHQAYAEIAALIRARKEQDQ